MFRSIFLLVLITWSVRVGFAQCREFQWFNTALPFEERIEILVAEMTLEEKVGQLLNSTPAIPRLGLPEYDWWNEALHGVARNGKATIFPQGIAIGASFDPDLAKRVASAISTEARAKYKIAQSQGNRGKYAGLTFWTPNVNVFRDPRWGRGQETYGEDPYLMSRIGVAFVNGLQGDDEKYLKSAACAKHFAVHSGPESLRHHFNANPSKQDLYETYFPAFEALVVEARVEGVMGAYNAVYDEPSCASTFLLQETLRENWDFKGYLVSDCGALGDIQNGHHKTNSIEEAAALALKSGINLNCGWAYNNLINTQEKGLITEELIDQRLKELLLTRFKLGMFDSAEGNPYVSYGVDKIHCAEHIELAKEAALKSIVLLKNENNVLPLSKDIKVPYVTGPFANSNDVLMGSYYGVTTNLVTVLEGIAEKISIGSSLNYRSGVLPFQANLNSKNWAPHVAAESDVTICVVGISADMEGEEVDAIAAAHNGDRKDLRLPQSQIDYIKEIARVKKGPLVLVLASGSPVSLEGIYDEADAILQMWYPGEQGGNALAEIVFGDVSPSGHLPITFPRSVDQLPAYDDYSMTGRTYKYMEEEPLFPFGFGLNYGTVSFTDLKVSKKGKGETLSFRVEVVIKNEGSVDIEELAQLYISPTKNEDNLPLYMLKRFKRVDLAAGEKKTISFNLCCDDLKMVDQKGLKRLIQGEYLVHVSNALPSQRSIDLGAAMPVSETINLK